MSSEKTAWFDVVDELVQPAWLVDKFEGLLTRRGVTRDQELVFESEFVEALYRFAKVGDRNGLLDLSVKFPDLQRDLDQHMTANEELFAEMRRERLWPKAR